MKIGKFLKSAGSAIYKAEQKSAEKPRIFGSSQKQIVFLVTIVLFSFWIGYKLLSYSILDGDKWRMLATDQQLSSVVIKANRGSIYDANGTVLAQSSTVWDITISPHNIELSNTEAKEKYEKDSKKLIEKGETPEPYVERAELISRKLSEVLDVDYNKIKTACTDYDNKYYIVKRKVEKPEANEITAFMKENGLNSDDIYLWPTSKRYYPNDSLASNIIGFTNFDGNGVYGLEAYYDDYLSGTDGKAVYAVSADGRELQDSSDAYYSAVDGYSLVLTLDEVLQHYLEKNLELCVSQNQVINRACGIIMNCNTGAVLAMATAPSFDLNDPSELKSSYDLQTLAEMKDSGATEEELDEKEASLREQQWKNKAITELYYPGSVFKTVTCASALEEEVVSLNSTFHCAAVEIVAGTRIKCWSSYGHGTLTLQQAVTKSCNPSFIQIGQLLGKDKFCDYFEAFGFTEPTGIDLPGESGSLYVSRENMGLVELASSSFGQTNKVTPLQMTTALCAIVNGGYLVTPYVVDKMLDSNGNVVKTTETRIKRQVISEETSAQMREILETVVNENGGSNAYINGYRIGGKSGTTEKIDEYNKLKAETGIDHMTYVPSFAAFAPADDPQIVMLVMADTPTGTQYYGSAVAAPVVSAVFKEGLPHLGIYPTYTAEELAKMDAAVPYVMGMEAQRAEAKLNAEGFEVRYVGDPATGAAVTTQIPASGSSIPKGSTVVLYLGNEYELQSAVIPDVTGMTVSQANEAITNAGFNIKISGGAAENANAVASTQYPLGGTDAYKGNVVEVTFQVNGYSD